MTAPPDVRVAGEPAHVTEPEPVVTTGSGLVVTVTLPPIPLVQPVVASIAVTVYVPTGVTRPKLSAEPAPATGLPRVDAPLYNW